MIDHLERLSIFQDLANDDLDAIALFSEEYEFDDGEIIICEKSADSFDLYILVSGSVEVVANADGNQNVTDELVISKKDKDIFGEIGWLCQQERTATVRSYGSCKIIKVDGDSLRVYLKEHPEAGMNVMHRMAVILAQSLAETSNLLKQLLWVNGI